MKKTKQPLFEIHSETLEPILKNLKKLLLKYYRLAYKNIVVGPMTFKAFCISTIIILLCFKVFEVKWEMRDLKKDRELLMYQVKGRDERIKKLESAANKVEAAKLNIADPVSETCPFYSKTDINLEFSNDISVAYPPKALDEKEIIISPQKFDPKADWFDDGYIYSTGGKKAISYENHDFDGDGQKEQIVSIDVAMNHMPHVALIVKNGTILFKDDGAQTYIFDTFGGSFKVHKTIDWNTGEEKIIKYKFKDDKVFPIWEQKLCNVRIKK